MYMYIYINIIYIYHFLHLPKLKRSQPRSPQNGGLVRESRQNASNSNLGISLEKMLKYCTYMFMYIFIDICILIFFYTLYLYIYIIFTDSGQPMVGWW